MSTVDMRTWAEGRERTWTEAAMDRELSPELRRCVETLCATDAPYNLPLINNGWYEAVDYSLIHPEPNPYEDEAQECKATPAVVIHPSFILVRMNGTMSTYDCSRLTEIVIAAHKHLVRVQFSSKQYVYEAEDTEHFDYTASGAWEATGEPERGWGVCLEIQLNARQAAGDGVRLYDRHPDLDELIERVNTIKERS